MSDWVQGPGGYGTGGFEHLWHQQETGDQGAAPSGYHHLPVVRPERIRWTRGQDGRWSASGEDEHMWEVVCVECGDTDGPAECQPLPAQALRGPYPSERLARRAAKKHRGQY